MTRVSARPERLAGFAETAVAITEALTQRATYLDDACHAYQLNNGIEWRFDFSDLAGALSAWAGTLATVGDWTARVGEAIRVADEDGDDGVHRFDEDRVAAMLSYDDRLVLDAGAATCAFVDWGEPDDPPTWLEDLREADMVIGYGFGPASPAWRDEAEGVDGLLEDAGIAADAVEVAYVVGEGADARWHSATPALLGRFASAGDASRFASVLSYGGAGVSGFLAGYDQWLADSNSVDFSESEAVGRTAVRGGGTAAASLGAGALGTLAASSWCGPGAPVCAVAVVGGFALGGKEVGDRALDRLLPRPDPAEHDPDGVREEILGLEPGYLLRDVPGETKDLVNALGEAAQEVPSTLERRHPFLRDDDFEPTMMTRYDLPQGWVADHHGERTAVMATMADLAQQPLPATPVDLTPEAEAAIERHEASLAGDGQGGAP